jgi:hypothetical protein
MRFQRGLAALESAGLVMVQRQTGQRSLVTILPVPVPNEERIRG